MWLSLLGDSKDELRCDPLDTKVNCPICENNSSHYSDLKNWGEMRQCLSCGFIFANPMSRAEESVDLFEAAYSGKETRSRMIDFHRRLRFRDNLKSLEIEPEELLRGSQREALRFIKENVAQGSSILDIGCGPGVFLDPLRNSGYKAFGLDVSEELVEILRDEGYSIWYGPIETLDDEWVSPALCVSFYVLHHLSDPIKFLVTIREKFPDAPLIVSEWNWIRNINRNLPPRALSRWTPRSLSLALERAGYKAKITLPKAVPNDFLNPTTSTIYFTMREILPARFVPLYWKMKIPICYLLSHLFRILNWQTSMLGIGIPEEVEPKSNRRRGTEYGAECPQALVEPKEAVDVNGKLRRIRVLEVDSR